MVFAEIQIPSRGKAPLVFDSFGGTEVPPFQNDNLFSASITYAYDCS